MGVCRKIKRRGGNTDTRLGPDVFLTEKPNRQIAIDELEGGDALKTFLGYMEVASGLEEASAKQMRYLKCLIRRKPIDHIRGQIEGGILKFLVSGDLQTPGAKVRVSKIRQVLNDFTRRQKEERKLAHVNYMRKIDETKQVGDGLGLRIDSNFTPKGIG